MAKRVIGLDIGVHSIKVVHLEDLKVVKTHEVNYSPEAFAALKPGALLDGNTLVTGLSGADAQVRSLEVPFSNSKKIQAILGGVLDAQLPLEITDLTLSWFLQTDKKDPQQNILAAFAKKNSIRSYLKLLEDHGANPQILTLKSAGLYELLKQQAQGEQLIALVDIGHSSTSICVGDAQKMWVTRSVFKSSPEEVIREIRQTMMVLSKPIEKIYLVGGGALSAGIASEFTRFLGISTEVLKPLSLSPVFALALSYALIGSNPHEKRNRFNLRKEEFAFRSDMRFVLGPSQASYVWAAILCLILFFNYGVRRYFLSARIDDLKQEEQALCQRVTGQNSCLSVMKKALAQDKQNQVPNLSALDIYLEVSKSLPTDIQLKVTDLDIADKTVKLSGDTENFEAVDQIVSSLSQAKCFKNVDKGRARQTQAGVNFQISMDVSCGGAS